MRKKKLFLRTGYTQYSKLGLRRKNKQVYRKSKGGENKIRLKMKGHLRNVNIGYRTKKDIRGQINGLTKILVHSIKDLEKLKANEIAVVIKLGKKKKIEFAQYSLKHNIKILNLNSKKYLDKVELEKKKIKEEKNIKEQKKKETEKKTKEALKEKENKDNKETKDTSASLTENVTTKDEIKEEDKQ